MIKSLLCIITLILISASTFGSYVWLQEDQNLHLCANKEVTDLTIRVFDKVLQPELRRHNVDAAIAAKIQSGVRYRLDNILVESSDARIQKAECNASLIATLPADVVNHIDLDKLRAIVAKDSMTEDVEVLDNGELSVRATYGAHKTLDATHLYANLSGSARPLAWVIAAIANGGGFGKTLPEQSPDSQQQNESQDQNPQ